MVDVSAKKSKLMRGAVIFINWLIGLYFVARTLSLFVVTMSWQTRIIATLFYIAESFFLVQTYGYFRYLRQVSLFREKAHEVIEHPPVLPHYPPVAIVVASYREPLEVLEDTLVCFHSLSYPHKRLYFLDDTRYDEPWDTPEVVEEYKQAVNKLCASTRINLFRRKWHHAKAGMINDFLEYIQGKRTDEFVMIRHDDKEQGEPEKYIVIFDADMNPIPTFVEPLVNLLEREPHVAFVQTPQYYTNFQENRVARAASNIQVVFYEWICEAKGIQNLALLCGTNVIIRVDALKDVGGIDVGSVTEDFATAFRLHTKNWKSIYLNRVCAFGMGPEDLGSFFKQQHRWALGTTDVFVKLVKGFFSHAESLKFSFWWEYLLSSSYYLIGWMYLILMMGPLLYIFFDVTAYVFPPLVYATLMIPNIVLSNFLFYWSLGQRGYSFRELFSGVTLNMLCLPVYIDAVTSGLFGFKGQFVVTPKGESNVLPMIDLWPQIALALISFATIVWGGLRLWYEQEHFFGISINLFWSLYYFLMFSSVFYFNSAEKAYEPLINPNALPIESES
jgi:cellulose synthase (UDP-forming)